MKVEIFRLAKMQSESRMKSIKSYYDTLRRWTQETWKWRLCVCVCVMAMVWHQSFRWFPTFNMTNYIPRFGANAFLFSHIIWVAFSEISMCRSFRVVQFCFPTLTFTFNFNVYIFNLHVEVACERQRRQQEYATRCRHATRQY